MKYGTIVSLKGEIKEVFNPLTPGVHLKVMHT